MRLREVDRLHAREILVAVGDAVRASGGMRALGPELGLERLDEHLEEIERQRVGIAPDGLAHDFVDHGTDDDRPLAFARRRLVYLPHCLGDAVGRIDEWNRYALELERVELRE